MKKVNVLFRSAIIVIFLSLILGDPKYIFIAGDISNIFVYWSKHNGVWKLGQFLCLCERQSKHFLKISVKLTDSHNITIVLLKTNN